MQTNISATGEDILSCGLSSNDDFNC